jgi:L-seryl-tRNA(Ser) seleniumtransferase
LQALLPRYMYASYLASEHSEIYRQIGIRPFINAAGTYTVLTGSIVPPKVREAMAEASRSFVPLVQLQTVVGVRIAKMLGVEAAMVTSGAACSIMLATAACVTGKDKEKIRRIPDVTGMKSEVIIPKAQRNGFDHAARNVGIRLIEVETIGQVKSSISSKTAMLYWTNIMAWKGKIARREFLEAGKVAGIPVFNDAAAELPPAENLSGIVREGFDLVAFSGGKGLRGPQSAGLLLGRKDLVEAAQLNGNPNDDAIGRVAKTGKEELMGMLAAVELYLSRDHEADQREWRGFMESIASDLKDVETVKTKLYIPDPGEGPGGGHPVPYLKVQWDQAALRLTPKEPLHVRSWDDLESELGRVSP